MNFFSNEAFRKMRNSASDAKESLFEITAPRTLAVVGIAALVGAVYFVASQTTGAPNYAANYDNVQPPKGSAGYGSKIVAVTAAMLSEEQSRGWCPSESFLTPSSWRTDTCAYQLGEESIISRITYTMREDVASVRTLSTLDSDLDIAVQKIQAGPYIWGVFYSTDHNYKTAVDHLNAYNENVANGKATFSPRIDNLAEVVKTLMHATGTQVGTLESMNLDGVWLTGKSRAEFVEAKGAFAAACTILKAATQPEEKSSGPIKGDFADVIDKQSATDTFDSATSSVCAVNQIDTPLLSLYLTSDKKTLTAQGEIAVAKLRDAYTTLASGAGNGPS